MKHLLSQIKKKLEAHPVPQMLSREKKGLLEHVLLHIYYSISQGSDHELVLEYSTFLSEQQIKFTTKNLLRGKEFQ